MIFISKAIYSSKIIKASALLADTKMLLSYWDESLSTEENLHGAYSENIFGKASRSRVKDILAILRQRYFKDPSVSRALVTFVREGLPAEVLHPILYFYALQSDRLLHDVVTEIIGPMRERGETAVHIDYITEVLSGWVREGKTSGDWAPNTTRRVAGGVLCTLRDFGILQGLKKKTICPIYLPLRAFAFTAFELHRRQASGHRLLHDPEWKIFFLSTQAVERFFVEGHQEKLLEYYAAGSVVRIEFAAKTLEEYAYALTQRKNLSS